MRGVLHAVIAPSSRSDVAFEHWGLAMFCGKCGATVAEGNTFCVSCGTPTPAASATAPSSTASAATAPDAANASPVVATAARPQPTSPASPTGLSKRNISPKVAAIVILGTLGSCAMCFKVLKGSDSTPGSTASSVPVGTKQRDDLCLARMINDGVPGFAKQAGLSPAAPVAGAVPEMLNAFEPALASIPDLTSFTFITEFPTKPGPTEVSVEMLLTRGDCLIAISSTMIIPMPATLASPENMESAQRAFFAATNGFVMRDALRTELTNQIARAFEREELVADDAGNFPEVKTDNYRAHLSRGMRKDSSNQRLRIVVAPDANTVQHLKVSIDDPTAAAAAVDGRSASPAPKERAEPSAISPEARAAFRSEFGCDKVSFANRAAICEIDGTFQANTQGIARSRNIPFEVYAKSYVMQKLLFEDHMKVFLEANRLEKGTVVLYAKTVSEDKFGKTVGRSDEELARATVTLETLRKVNFKRAAEIANDGEVEFVRWASALVE